MDVFSKMSDHPFIYLFGEKYPILPQSRYEILR